MLPVNHSGILAPAKLSIRRFCTTYNYTCLAIAEMADLGYWTKPHSSLAAFARSSVSKRRCLTPRRSPHIRYSLAGAHSLVAPGWSVACTCAVVQASNPWFCGLLITEG